MKVLHILSDTNIGGAGRCALTLAKYLNGPECAVEVILPENSALRPEFEKIGVGVTEAPRIGERSFDPRAIAGLLRLIRAKNPDIVHTHAALSGRVAARLGGKSRLVYTRHSVFDVPAKNRRFPRKQAIGFVNNFFSDAIIAVSPAARDNLTAVGTDPEKIRVIMNGAEPVEAVTAAERAALRRGYGFGENDFVVSAAARLVPEKGHETLLDAARLLAEHPPGGKTVKFLIAGEGPSGAALRAKAAAEKIPGVVFAGFVRDIGGVFNITDLQANASWGTEATSVALLQGMSLGVPAVASDFGGNPYVIRNGENGLLFPAKDPRALADAIRSVCLNRETYDKMTINARRIYREEFTAEAMAERTLALYEKLL
ncbi:MAG: glycosyltransferase [Firmicutes bacterium]|nr:glycosyltransferase [Bacillota bacterium]